VNPSWNNSLLPELSDLPRITEVLTQTSLGSSVLQLPRRIKWQLPGKDHNLEFVDRIDARKSDNSIRISQVFLFTGGKFALALQATGQSHFTLTSKGREIYTEANPPWLQSKTLSDKLPGIKYILEAEWFDAEVAIDGTPVLGNSLQKVIGNIISNFLDMPSNSTEILDWINAVNRQQQIISANRLRERKETVQNGRFVWLGEKKIHREPQNEQDVVILLSKLDVLSRHHPFHNFNLWEHTAKVGIDAIIDIQVDAIDEPDPFATMEIEYKLSNFISHRHPTELTKYIACWYVDNVNPKHGTLKRDSDRPWLWHYTVEKRILSVFEIKSFPDVNVK